MNFNDYFDPVSLSKSEYNHIPEELSLSRKITIHTPDQPVGDLKTFDLAIFGVPEEKNATVKGSSDAPDSVREKLYQLSSFNRKTKIIDLGNLRITQNINDTYYAIRDIIRELETLSVLPVIIGGSQDLTFAMDLACNDVPYFYHLITLDNKLDLDHRYKNISSSNYLEHILADKNLKKFSYTNLGSQIYYTPSKIQDIIDKRGYENIRLGIIRSDLSEFEPVIRDATLISLDMSCVRQSDAPGVIFPSPNGFFGHELCQLARYAGTATNLKAFGIFELCPANDINSVTSCLAAQIIWYFIDGFSLKIKEDPQSGSSKKFIVNLNSVEQELVFYKSLKTERWWIEMPFINPLSSKKYLISCSHSDYQMACNNEIPDRWWKAFHRLS